MKPKTKKPPTLREQFPHTLSSALKRLQLPSGLLDSYRRLAPPPDFLEGSSPRWKELPFSEQWVSVVMVDRQPHLCHPREDGLFTGPLTVAKVWVSQFLTIHHELPHGKEALAFCGRLERNGVGSHGYSGREFKAPLFTKPTEAELSKARKTPPFRVGNISTPVIQGEYLFNVPVKGKGEVA